MLDSIQIEKDSYNKEGLPMLLQSPLLPYVFWIAKMEKTDIINYYVNALLNETKFVSKTDLLGIHMIKDELLVNGWKVFTPPPVRVIAPNGDFRDI